MSADYLLSAESWAVRAAQGMVTQYRQVPNVGAQPTEPIALPRVFVFVTALPLLRVMTGVSSRPGSLTRYEAAAWSQAAAVCR
jgi:hypothetical protein